MFSGGKTALLASHVIDDLVLPINCIDQQSRLALSVTADCKALCCPSAELDLAVFVRHGRICSKFQRVAFSAP
jgi:hypothetical protein